MSLLRPITRTVSAAIVGFAVGAGAVSGGMAAYTHFGPSHALALKSSKQPPFATVASYTPPTLPLGPDTISNVVKRDGDAVVKIVASVPQSTSISSSPYFNPFFGSLFGNSLP
jgi:hypothetical protein